MNHERHERRAGLCEICVDSVDERGRVLLRFPGGWLVTFVVSTELAPYYRRLVRKERRGRS